MNRTFTQEVKLDILESQRSIKEWKLFLVVVLKQLSFIKEKKVYFRILNKELREKLYKLMYKIFSIKPSKENSYLILNMEKELKNFTLDLQDVNLNSEKDYQTFLAGLFVSRGYVNSPKSKYYHLEIRVKKLIDAININELILEMGISSKFILKNNWYYVYVKKSDHISDMLTAFKSPTYSIIFIDQKIKRDFNATLSRQNSLDVYNQMKIAETSLAQCIACKKVLKDLIKYKLRIEEIRIAKLRLKFPDYSMNDLSIEYNIKYEDRKSKPTINRWLKKIIMESKNE